jgi:hypothetical protein
MKMLRIVIMAGLYILLALNLVVPIVNFSGSSKAAMAGMKFESLASDPDFVKAVKSIVEKCKVNVDLARVEC